MIPPFFHALSVRDRQWGRVAIMLATAPVAGVLISFPVMIALFALGGGERP